MLTKEEMGEVLGRELDAAIASAVTDDGGRMKQARLYYEGALPANDDPNQDPNREAVSLDVADMVEAVYAQMAPAFEDVGAIEFEAVNAEDEQAAAQESAIVRGMLMEGHASEGGFVALTEAIKDALMAPAGRLSIGVVRTETRTPEEWRGVIDPGEVAKPNQPNQRIEKLTIVEDEDEPREEGDELPRYVVKFERVDMDKRMSVSAIAPEDFVTASLEERDPNASRFCAERIVTTRGRLIAEGFPKGEVAALKRHDPTTYELWQGRVAEVTTLATDAAQRSTETVELWRCYAMLGDTPTDPAAQRFRVYYSRDNKRVIGEAEQVGRVCVAVGNVVIYPHRQRGVNMADRIAEIQEIKSKALRAWVENLHKVNRPRIGVDESLVNIADARDATQDIVRMKGAGGFVAIPTVDAGPSVLAFLDYQDRARSERGGASLDMQGAAIQVASNQTAQGIERQYSTKEQLAAAMARTFAETALRQAYLIVHYLLRTQWGGPVTVKAGGEWVEADPSTWRPRRGVVVRVGQSQSERARKVAALGQVMQAQAMFASSGKAGILVDDSRIFNAACDWIAAAQLRSPERYLIDPSSKQAMATTQANQKQAAAMQRAQADVMNAQWQLEKYKVDVGALTDLVGELVKAAIEEAKLTMVPDPLDEVQQLGQVAAAGAGSNAAQGAKALTKGPQS